MTLHTRIDSFLAASPLESVSSSRRSDLLLIALALLSWTVGEVLMTPVLKTHLIGFWLVYMGCMFIMGGWYFRASRLFDGAWTSFPAASAPLVWALAPLYLMVPAGLLAAHMSGVGMIGYAIFKAGAILTVVSRLGQVFQVLNRWPRWAAMALTLSPLAVAFIGLCVILLISSLGVVALALSALKS